MSALRFISSIFWATGMAAVLLLMGCQGQAEEEPPANPVVQQYLWQGTQALRHHQFNWALALADSAAKHAPHSSDVAMLRGRIYSELGRFKKAEKAYRRALEREPDYKGVWLNLGNNAYRQSEYRKATTYYRRELDKHPGPAPWRGIGRALVEIGETDSAEYAFRQSIGQDSSYAPAYYSLALLYEDEGAFPQALKYAREAWQRDSTNAGFEYLVGTMLLKNGQPEKALPRLLSVAKEQPWHQGAHYNLGQAMVRLGHQKEGQKLLKKAEELRSLEARIQHLQNTIRSVPDDPYAHAALGSALRRAGRYNDAMHAFKVSTYLDPSNTDVQNNIANLHLVRGDTTRAIQQYQRILQRDSSLVDIWLNLGVVYMLAGHKERARTAWKKALEHEPNNEVARNYLQKLRQAS